MLLEFFDLGEADLYRLNGPLSMTHLAPLIGNDAFAKLKDRVFQPTRDPDQPPHANLFEVMRKQDVLLHHPYESFDPIGELIENAAEDPQVLAIKITLYRTSGDSSIVEALIHAAKPATGDALAIARALDEAATISGRGGWKIPGDLYFTASLMEANCKALLIVRAIPIVFAFVHLGKGH